MNPNPKESFLSNKMCVVNAIAETLQLDLPLMEKKPPGFVIPSPSSLHIWVSFRLSSANNSEARKKKQVQTSIRKGLTMDVRKSKQVGKFFHASKNIVRLFFFFFTFFSFCIGLYLMVILLFQFFVIHSFMKSHKKAWLFIVLATPCEDQLSHSPSRQSSLAFVYMQKFRTLCLSRCSLRGCVFARKREGFSLIPVHRKNAECTCVHVLLCIHCCSFS